MLLPPVPPPPFFPKTMKHLPKLNKTDRILIADDPASTNHQLSHENTMFRFSFGAVYFH